MQDTKSQMRPVRNSHARGPRHRPLPCDILWGLNEEKRIILPDYDVDEVVDLEIADVVYPGRGIARVDNFVVFVPGTIAGEHVRAQITKRRSRFAEARLLEVTQPAPTSTLPTVSSSNTQASITSDTAIHRRGTCGCPSNKLVSSTPERAAQMWASRVLLKRNNESPTLNAMSVAMPGSSTSSWNQAFCVVLLPYGEVTRMLSCLLLHSNDMGQPVTVTAVTMIVKKARGSCSR